MKTAGILACCLSLAAGCGSLDPGETTVSRWRTVPSPVTFANSVHPALVESCATSGCHARSGSLMLHATDVSLPADSGMLDPCNLPEPLKEDYFAVMAFCDLDLVQSSPLLVWGDGRQASHPGGSALEDAVRDRIVDWLEGN